MMQASPVEMRKALEMVTALKNAGLSFVPMPVINAGDYEQLHAQALERIAQIAEEAES